MKWPTTKVRTDISLNQDEKITQLTSTSRTVYKLLPNISVNTTSNNDGVRSFTFKLLYVYWDDRVMLRSELTLLNTCSFTDIIFRNNLLLLQVCHRLCMRRYSYSSLKRWFALNIDLDADLKQHNSFLLFIKDGGRKVGRGRKEG